MGSAPECWGAASQGFSAEIQQTHWWHSANRCSCPPQSPQAFILGLALVILVILFALTGCRVFRPPLLFVAGLVLQYGVGFQRGWGALFFLLGSYWACSSKILGCQRVLAALQGGCRECRSCSLALGSCSPCRLQLTEPGPGWKHAWKQSPCRLGDFPDVCTHQEWQRSGCCCCRWGSSLWQDVGVWNWHNTAGELHLLPLPSHLLSAATQLLQS